MYMYVAMNISRKETGDPSYSIGRGVGLFLKNFSRLRVLPWECTSSRAFFPFLVFLVSAQERCAGLGCGLSYGNYSIHLLRLCRGPTSLCLPGIFQ